MNIPVLIFASLIFATTLLLRQHLMKTKRPILTIIQRHQNLKIEYQSQLYHNTLWLIIAIILLISGLVLPPLYFYGGRIGAPFTFPNLGWTEDHYYIMGDITGSILIIIVSYIIGEFIINIQLTFFKWELDDRRFQIPRHNRKPSQNGQQYCPVCGGLVEFQQPHCPACNQPIDEPHIRAKTQEAADALITRAGTNDNRHRPWVSHRTRSTG